MEISGKNLLNQAENILRDRKQENRSGRPDKSVSAEKSRETPASGVHLSQGVMESRVLGLQESLKNLQNQYSREQKRFAYLTQNQDQINSDLKFEKDPLFPELRDGRGIDGLESTVKQKMNEILRGLKANQVEMENLFALNFQEREPTGLDSGAIAGLKGSTQLNPDRVARLTR